MSRKRVSFSQMDEIIASPRVDSEASSEGLAEAYEDVFEEDGFEATLVHRIEDALSPSPSSPHDGLVDLPATPFLRTRELPPVDEVTISSANIVSRLSEHSSTTSSSSLRSSSISSPGVKIGYIADDQSTSLPEESDPSFILSRHLTSGQQYNWDLNVNPLFAHNRLLPLLTDEGYLPAAFSANSRASYTDQITVRHRALPWTLIIQPKEDGECVSIRDVFISIHTFLQRDVSDAEVSRESSSRRRSIIQAAMSRSRSQIRRVDWLLDECVFAGLSLGKDGKTVTLLTSSIGLRR